MSCQAKKRNLYMSEGERKHATSSIPRLIVSLSIITTTNNNNNILLISNTQCLLFHSNFYVQSLNMSMRRTRSSTSLRFRHLSKSKQSVLYIVPSFSITTTRVSFRLYLLQDVPCSYRNVVYTSLQERAKLLQPLQLLPFHKPSSSFPR